MCFLGLEPLPPSPLVTSLSNLCPFREGLPVVFLYQSAPCVVPRLVKTGSLPLHYLCFPRWSPFPPHSPAVITWGACEEYRLLRWLHGVSCLLWKKGWRREGADFEHRSLYCHPRTNSKEIKLLQVFRNTVRWILMTSILQNWQMRLREVK